MWGYLAEEGVSVMMLMVCEGGRWECEEEGGLGRWEVRLIVQECKVDGVCGFGI